jgi:hypothetical protein
MYSGSLRDANANAPSALGSTLASANGWLSLAPQPGQSRVTSSNRKPEAGAVEAEGWAAMAGLFERTLSGDGVAQAVVSALASQG